MHIDGIMEVREVDGYNINLLPMKDENESGIKKYSYDEVKKIK